MALVVLMCGVGNPFELSLFADAARDEAIGEPALERQVEFILDKQTPTGAIQKVDGYIEPYAANTAALGLLAVDTATSRAAVLKWMEWTMAHLNRVADADGLTFTINDWKVVDGVESPQEPTDERPVPYDSADSYAATALSVAAAAYRSEDSELQRFVRENIVTYEHIANLLTYEAPGGVRMPNGLTRALGRFSSEYTMDNTEVYAGLRDLGWLESELGRTDDDYNYYAIWAGTTRDAINRGLWNDETSSWNLATGSPGNGEFYQSGMPNYFPSLFGLNPIDDERNSAAWTELEHRWPRWASGEIGTCAPVASLVVAALNSGRDEQAHTLLTDYFTRYTPDDWSYPTHCPGNTENNTAYWHVGEAGWYLQAATRLAGTNRFTWNTATHPAGSAKNDHGTVGGGVWRSNGYYFLPTAGHVALALGGDMKEVSPNGEGIFGKVAYSTRAYDSAPEPVDIALIAAGTKAIAPVIRVSNDREQVPINGIGSPYDIRAGDRVCQSGTSDATLAAGGVLCGTVSTDCERNATSCHIVDVQGIANTGDSGAAVWKESDGGGVTLLGWIVTASGSEGHNGRTAASFVPTWALQDLDWQPSHSWTPGSENIPPFSRGKQTAGCFLTTHGCVRV